MPEHNAQAFYNDRRDRGMSDAMIVNELEASGWPLATAQAAVQQAKTVYIAKPTPGYSQTTDAIEFDVPQEFQKHVRTKLLMGFIITVPAVILDSIFTDDGFKFSWFTIFLALAIFSGLAFFSWFSTKNQTPRRIRLDRFGYTILIPSRRLHSWAEYRGFSLGQAEKKNTWFQRFAQPSIIPEAPTLTLHVPQSTWNNDRPADIQLPYPPQHKDAIQKFLQEVFAVKNPVVKKSTWSTQAKVLLFVALAIPIIATLVALVVGFSY